MEQAPFHFPAFTPSHHSRRAAALAPLTPVLALLIALLLFNFLFTQGFANIEVRDGRLYGSLVDVFENGAPVALLAIGMTLVISTGGIDLSVGSVMALAGCAAALTLTRGDQPAGVAIVVGLLAGACVGLANGLVVSLARLQPIVATLVTLVMARGLAQSLSNDQKVRFTNPAFETLGSGHMFGVPLAVILMLVLAVIVILLVRHTTLGPYLSAIGGNRRAAQLCGLPVLRFTALVYVFSGLCAALAGMIAAADIREADVANSGLYLELDAILAVVLGGNLLTGGRTLVAGSVCGALAMQTVTIMLQMRGVMTEVTLILKALVVLAVCLLQSPWLASVWERRRGALIAKAAS